MKEGSKRNNKNYFYNFLIFVVAFAVATALILPFRSILASYNLPLWKTDGSSTIHKDTGEVVIGDTTASGTLLLDVAGQVGATEYCDQDGGNCTAATALGSDPSNIHDADNNTIVHTETNANEDIIRFSTGGTERWTMTGTRIEPKNTGFSLFIGEDAGLNDDGNNNYNNFVGYQSGSASTTGSANNFIGYQAGNANITGSYNNFIGYQAGFGNTSGSTNNHFGLLAGYNSNGVNNNFLGGFAGYNTTGGMNNFLGYRAGQENITGAENQFMGWESGTQNTIGGINTFIGSRSGRWNTEGNQNTFIGAQAGDSNTLGSNNTYIGRWAGNNATTGTHNISVGYQTGIVDPIGNNQLNIGNMIYGTGIDGSNSTISTGAIGIGDNSPDTGTSTLKLDVEGPVGATEYCDENGNNCTAAGSLGGFTGTTGSVPFVGAAGSLTEDNASFFFDDTNNRLGIGTTSPNSSLDVNDTLKVDDGHIYLLDADTTNFYASEKITLKDTLDETDYASGTSITEMRDITINAGTMGVTDVKHFMSEYNYLHTDAASAHNYNDIYAYMGNIGHFGTGTVSIQKGLFQYSMLWGPGTIGSETGIQGMAGMSTANATGSVTSARGVSGEIHMQTSASGTIQYASALKGYVNLQATTSGTINNLRGLSLSGWDIGGSNTIDTSYGIYMDSSIDAGTTAYALYSASNSDSYLAGDLGIGTNAPSQQLELTKSIELVDTGASDEGVIYKGATPFIHNFNPPDNGTVDPLGYNTFIGLDAGNFTMGSTATVNWDSTYNTAIGYSSLNSNTIGQGNSALGYLTLTSNTTGDLNTAIGPWSLTANVDGANNTALGYSSLSTNTNGDQNTAVGGWSLHQNSIGNRNTAHGTGSLYYSTTGNENTAVGYFAGSGVADYVSSDRNTFLGYYAGHNVSSNMDYNIFLGERAGDSQTAGSRNLIIGSNIDAANLTGSNQMSIGNLIYGTALDGTGATISTGDIGIGRVPTTNRLEVNGDASKNVAGSWLANSDERLKTDIAQLNSQQMLDKILSLRGVSYEWNDDKTDMERPTGIQYGMIAQEIEEVFPSLVSEDANGYLQTAYGTYDAMLIEAIRGLREEKDEQIAALKDEKDQEIKELREENATQAQQITNLDEENKSIIKRLEALEQE